MTQLGQERKRKALNVSATDHPITYTVSKNVPLSIFLTTLCKTNRF